MNSVSLFIFTGLTLFFFASSSILCRMALVDDSMDAYSFTFFRLLFGVITLVILLYFKEKKLCINLKNNWSSASMLFIYAIGFSYAYMNLDAGLGALILFAVVQLTLISHALQQKQQLSLQKIIGIIVAFVGLSYLLYPSETINLSYRHVFLMILSGLAWGIYTIFGKQSTNALLHTTDNFIKALALICIAYFILMPTVHTSTYGIVLAFISGGITSALGYVLWYRILPYLAITSSGVLQLIVPVISIFLGILLLNEALSLALIVSTIIISIGIAICIYSKN